MCACSPHCAGSERTRRNLIMSASGAVTAAQELGTRRGDLDALADVALGNVRGCAAVASGSLRDGRHDCAVLDEDAVGAPTVSPTTCSRAPPM